MNELLFNNAGGASGGGQKASYLVKLTGANNFAEFKEQTLGVCYGIGDLATDILMGTSVCPAPVAPTHDGGGNVTNQPAVDARAAAIEAWRVVNRKLYLYLFFNLEEKFVKPLVAGIPPGGSREIWVRLCNHYQGTSIADTSRSVDNLIRTRMETSFVHFAGQVAQKGALVAQNTAAMVERNRLARIADAHAHVYTLEEVLQLAVLLSGCPKHFGVVVQSLWLKADLTFEQAVLQIADFESRWNSDPANTGARARFVAEMEAEAMAVTAGNNGNGERVDISIPTTAVHKEAKIVVGTNVRTGEKTPLICSHCSKAGHVAEACYQLNPELKTAYNARRNAAIAQRKIAKSANFPGVSSNSSVRQAEATVQQSLPWETVGGFAGSFEYGLFSAETIDDVSEERKESESHDESSELFFAVIDSGAFFNCANSLEHMHDYHPFDTPIPVSVASGDHVFALGEGVIGVFPFYYVPAIHRNLISVAAMADLGVTVELKHRGWIRASTEDGPLYTMVHRLNNLLYVEYLVRSSRELHPPVFAVGHTGSYLGMSFGHEANMLSTASAEAAQATVGEPVSGWVRMVVDSGATHNFVNTLVGVHDLDVGEIKQVKIANGAVLTSHGNGLFNGKFRVTYMPSFINNLCSVSAMADIGIAFQLGAANSAMIRESTGEKLATVHRVGNSFYVDFPVDSSAPAAGHSWMSAQRANLLVKSLDARKPVSNDRHQFKATAQYLHEVFHSSHPRLLQAINGNHFSGLQLSGPITQGDFGFDCSACMLGKAKQPPRISQDGHKRASVPFERLHIDSDIMSEAAWSGHKVALVVVDDYSNASWVLTCIYRNEQVQLLEDFICQTVGGLGFNVKKVTCATRNIRSDNAGEFTGSEFKSMLNRVKAHAEYTEPDTPQQNGRVERKIQTLLAAGRAIRLAAKLPIGSWAEVLKSASFLDNLLPTSVNPSNRSPMEMLTGKATDVRWLHPIGTVGAVHNGPRKSGVSKLDPNAVPGVLVGYSTSSRRYRMCTDLSLGTIVESDKVSFFHRPQALLPSRQSSVQAISPMASSERRMAVSDVVDDDSSHAAPIENAPVVAAENAPVNVQPGEAITRSGRVSRLPVRYRDDASEVAYVFCSKAMAEALAAKISYREAVQNPTLVASMKKELQHLLDSGAVSLVPLPADANLVGSTWAHKFKHDADNKPTYAKSRVCPQGFSQVAGVDYNPDEVAAPAVNLSSVFILLALTVHLDLHTALYDVDAAFTIPPLKENVYMKIPQGLERVPGYALKLNTSLNGLKQSAFNWHEHAEKVLVVLAGFKPTVADPCLYIRWKYGKVALIALYVDDFRTAFQCPQQKAEFEVILDREFPIKKLSGDFYLGMQVIHDREQGTIHISHEAYITNMLERFKMSDCKPVDTPAAPGTKLEKSMADAGELEASVSAFLPHYRPAVGALLWLARTTKPEIMYAVCQCAAHCSNPGKAHIEAVKRILRYCKGTISDSLILNRGEALELVCYSDADYAGEPELSDKPMKSLSGLVVGFKGIGFVCGQSSLQTTVSRSTAESEYRAGGAACQVILGLRNQLEEIGFKQAQPTVIWGDNDACVKMFKSPVSGAALRHIKIDHHFVRDHVKSGDIKMIHIPTERMVADIMTKALPRVLFKQHADTIRKGNL